MQNTETALFPGPAVVDRETSGAVPGCEACDLKAPVVIVETAGGGPNIEAAFGQDSNRKIAKHDLGFYGRSHGCAPRKKNKPRPWLLSRRARV
jgi:hypothetical protein